VIIFLHKLHAEKQRNDVLKAVARGTFDFVLLDRRGREPFASGIFRGARAIRFSLMRRMPVVGPFLPANIHFLDVETAPCQLQSYLCGKLSIVAPTVGDKLLQLATLGGICGEEERGAGEGQGYEEAD
jgi:hypothetical protein